MNVYGAFYGGPRDGATVYVADVAEAPVELVFAAAMAVVGWDVTQVSETRYRLESVSKPTSDFAVARYEHAA